MNIKRSIALILALIFTLSLSSCDPHYFPQNQRPQAPSTPEQPTTPEDEGGEGNVTYVYNITRKTLHLPDCHYAEDMDPELRVEYTGDITLLLQKGYTICKVCLVTDTDKDDDEPEEEVNTIPKEDATYAINTRSRVFHLVNCHNVTNSSGQNIRYTNLTVIELISLDYSPCGSCLPEEYKKYKESNPD